MTNIKPYQVLYIQGTNKKGCTAHFGEHFLSSLQNRIPCEVTRFTLPRDGPGFCTGCALCFTRGMAACPHADAVQPIWEAMCDADLIVLAQPTYAFGPPAQVKALLDHIACRWLVHSPEPRMLNKRVLVLSQAVGMGMGRSAKAVATNFRFLGAARVKRFTFSITHTVLAHMSPKKRARIERKLDKLTDKLSHQTQPTGPSALARLMFPVMRRMHALISKKERAQGRSDTYDYLYWQEMGWMGQSAAAALRQMQAVRQPNEPQNLSERK